MQEMHEEGGLRREAENLLVDCQDAAHVLQRHYQKQGLEAARMDPACDGYDFWTIVDVVVKQGNTYSAQGFLNPFWEPKSKGYTPAEFGVFNAATVLLLKTEPGHRIAVSGDRVRADFWISHYGEEPLKQARLAWTLLADKTVLAEGTVEGGDVELGSVRSLGQSDFVIPELQKPVHAVLQVSLAGGPAGNQWDFWLFPKRAPQRVTGIAVSKPLLPKLAPLYSGLVAAGDPGAGQALCLSRSWVQPMSNPPWHPANVSCSSTGRRENPTSAWAGGRWESKWGRHSPGTPPWAISHTKDICLRWPFAS